MKRNFITALALGIALLAAAAALAQDTDSVAILKAAVTAHPDSLSLHKRYIDAFRKSIPGANWRNGDSIVGLLEPQYQAWMAQNPGSAVVPFAMGDAFVHMESPKAKPYLDKAAALNPHNADTWEDLWEDASRWGDFKAATGYLQKATEADPHNPDYAFYYSTEFENDPVKYEAMTRDFIRRFPDSDRGAQALYWLAYRNKDESAKLSLYKEMKEKYPPSRSYWCAAGMSNYFDLILVKDPETALQLAHDMQAAIKEADDRKTWDQNVVIAGKILSATKALAAHRAADAVATLAPLKLNRWSGAKEDLILLKARALDAAGHTAAAYDSVLVFYVKEPSDPGREALVTYGSRLGKDAAKVDAEVIHRRNELAEHAPAFTLFSYLTGDSLSLASYRGKVVLLTFWFPGCGPCRGEFPHFQEVVDKFKGQDLAFVGINVLTMQDPYVVPFMKSSGYSFTPLRDATGVVQKQYKVRGEPTNFVIDRDGRIIFSDFMIQNPKAERMLELMIGSLLVKAPGATPPASS
jgi:thiol-disulfide isomerase/thioredoxin